MGKIWIMLVLLLNFAHHSFAMEFINYRLYITQEAGASSMHLLAFENTTKNAAGVITFSCEPAEHLQVDVNPDTISGLQPGERATLSVNIKNSLNVLLMRKHLSLTIVAKNEAGHILDQIEANVNIEPGSFIWILFAALLVAVMLILFVFVFRRMAS